MRSALRIEWRGRVGMEDAFNRLPYSARHDMCDGGAWWWGSVWVIFIILDPERTGHLVNSVHVTSACQDNFWPTKLLKIRCMIVTNHYHPCLCENIIKYLSHNTNYFLTLFFIPMSQMTWDIAFVLMFWMIWDDENYGTWCSEKANSLASSPWISEGHIVSIKTRNVVMIGLERTRG